MSFSVVSVFKTWAINLLSEIYNWTKNIVDYFLELKKKKDLFEKKMFPECNYWI